MWLNCENWKSPYRYSTYLLKILPLTHIRGLCYLHLRIERTNPYLYLQRVPNAENEGTMVGTREKEGKEGLVNASGKFPAANMRRIESEKKGKERESST